MLAENNARMAFNLIEAEMPHGVVGVERVSARDGRSYFSQ